MSVAKINGLVAGAADFASQLAAFEHGKCYIGEGSYTAGEADTAFADLGALATELGSSLSEISDLGEKPGKEESKVEKLKTSNYVIEGKRTNTVELTLIGLNQERKDWLESSLNDSAKTIVLVSSSGKDVLVFTGMRWTYERSTELNGLFTATISTEFSGQTSDKYRIYMGLESGT